MLAFLLAVVLVLLLSTGYGALGYDKHREKCNAMVEAWSEQALHELSELPEDHQLHLKELLYFLHVPRTGGRTFHQCLLRHLYPKEQHCDRSYDKLRFNSSNHCRLLVNHDDYSILTKLPAQSTSVVTNIRHPVDRIFSAYEFSVEVAARFLSQKLRRKPRVTKTAKNMGASTLNIWPWSLLVPWMRDDLFTREKVRLSGGTEPLPLGFSNYDASSFVMPLHKFIHEPMVIDVLHNGATFQVAGLTNNSYIKEAGRIRKCTIDYPDLGLHVLHVAKRRIDKMVFVGLTDKHGDSAKLFAHIVGGQILPLGQPMNEINELAAPADPAVPTEGTSEHRGLVEDPQFSQVPVSSDPGILPLPPKENLTVHGLIQKYETCGDRLRSTQIQRRISSLRNSLPVNFSSEARHEVAEETLDAIRQMNSLDLDLYAYAQQKFKHYQILVHDFSHSQISEQYASDQYLTRYSESVIDQGLQGGSASRNWMVVMVLCMAGGVVTMVAGLVVFVHGRRILKFQSRVVHEKL